jgi:hypothetical protein
MAKLCAGIQKQAGMKEATMKPNDDTKPVVRSDDDEEPAPGRLR